MVDIIVIKNKEDFYPILPPPTVIQMKDKNGFLVGAFNKTKALIGLAAFTFSKLDIRDVILNDIYVVNDYRNQGISTLMLEYVSEKLKPNGIHTMSCTLMGTVSELTEIYEYFLAEEFIPITMTGRLIKYDFKTILECKALQPLLEHRPATVKKEEELEKQKIKNFFQQILKHNLLLLELDYDKHWSRFYIQQEEVVGCMLIRVTQIGELNMYFQHLNAAAKASLAIPAMIADCINSACKQYSETAIFSMSLIDNQLYEAFCKVVGTPQQEYYYHQYSKTL